eukprot:2795040-Prymnesium_polylepis.1
MQSQLELTSGDEKMPKRADGTPKFILTDGRTDGDLSYPDTTITLKTLRDPQPDGFIMND